MNNENRGSPCILFAHSENSEVGKRLPELEPSNEKKNRAGIIAHKEYSPLANTCGFAHIIAVTVREGE